MRHPFQCIATLKPPGQDEAYLLAASGPKLTSTCLSTGDVVTEWSATEPTSHDSKSMSAESKRAENGEGPSKKQKTAPSSTPTLPIIIKLAISADQSHAVAVTDDKCVRVFHVSNHGQLSELTSRTMPKRPCAIHILPDNATILCGDKFGDVYSLPLLPKDPAPLNSPDHTPSPAPQPTPFIPSATPQTVHTKRNLKALESQRKQKNLTPKTKQPLAFHHNLLLGHVSMLTDVAHASRVVAGQQRDYILTADRDEHIRVSRGPPQTHIIETYCLGHTAFVSKLCILPGTDLLLSGGGDEWLGLWHWPEGRLKLALADFGDGVRSILEENHGYAPDQPTHLAVSGIWRVTADAEGGGTADAVLIACEGLPVLVDVPVSELVRAGSDGGPTWSFGSAGAPVLDAACVDSKLFFSLDVREEGEKPLRALKVSIKRTKSGTEYFEMERDEGLEVVLEKTVQCAGRVDEGKKVDELVYGVGRLRKRGNAGEEGDGGDGEDGGDD